MLVIGLWEGHLCVSDWFILFGPSLCSATVSHSLFNSRAEQSSVQARLFTAKMIYKHSLFYRYTHARATYESIFLGYVQTCPIVFLMYAHRVVFKLIVVFFHLLLRVMVSLGTRYSQTCP